MPSDSLLQADEIVRTARTLESRITERFPGSGLGKACARLVAIADDSKLRAEEIARPIWPLRVAVGLVILLMLSIVAGVFLSVEFHQGAGSFFEFVQAMEALVNDLVFIGAAIFFLVTIENRIKRRRALAALHELRSLAHIVDMHQLTKDPERVLQPQDGPPTEHSPKRRMSRFELARYLDYCSEMLALLSKIAALYAERFDDSVAIAAVDQIEDLAAGLSRKIWQKMVILTGARV